MHRLIAIGAGLLAIAGLTSAAFAADLPLKAPGAAGAPIPFTWTGCFAGVHAGGDFSFDKIRSSSDFTSGGFIGGGQIGCDYQFATNWVVGVEGRAAWSSLTSNTVGAVTIPALGATVPTRFTVSNDVLASATARVGYSFAKPLAHLRARRRCVDP
jgi:outer membrane immunogenic protein